MSYNRFIAETASPKCPILVSPIGPNVHLLRLESINQTNVAMSGNHAVYEPSKVRACRILKQSVCDNTTLHPLIKQYNILKFHSPYYGVC